MEERLRETLEAQARGIADTIVSIAIICRADCREALEGFGPAFEKAANAKLEQLERGRRRRAEQGREEA